MGGISAEEKEKRKQEYAKGITADTPIAAEGVPWEEMTALQRYNAAAIAKNEGNFDLWNKIFNDTPSVSTSTPTPTYTPSAYIESDLVQQAKNALGAHLANKPGAYQSQWQTQLNDIIKKILEREDFSYDLNGDALYQQYKDKYIQQGKMAMGDAIGQASAMTGGYGNSYAQSVGQQAYQAQLDNLNDIVPELYQMALDKYNMDGQELYNQYSMLGTEDDRDYGRYRDSVNDYLTDRNYYTNRYDAERNFDYGMHRDNVSDYQWQKEYDLATSKVIGTPIDDTTPDESISESDIKAMQAVIGVGQDGIWGPKSTAAAGGLTLEEAYKAWKNGTLKKDLSNSENVINFQNSILPESSHDAIAREMYGPYTAYVGLKIFEDKNLTEDEKAYLFSLHGVTDSDEQYLRDKGWLEDDEQF